MLLSLAPASLTFDHGRVLCLLPWQVIVEIIKIILQYKQPEYKLENHTPLWLVENHRLHFYLPSHGKEEAGILLIYGAVRHRAVVDRIVPEEPYPTTAVHPDADGIVDPIVVILPAQRGAGSAAAGAAAASPAELADWATTQRSPASAAAGTADAAAACTTDTNAATGIAAAAAASAAAAAVLGDAPPTT